MGTDTQPYALLVSLIILVCNYDRVSLPKNMVIYSVSLIAYATIILAFSIVRGIPLFEGVRSYVNYISISVIPVATYEVLEESNGVDETQVKWAIFIWLIVALIQYFISKSFGSFLLEDLRTTDNRGVTSLTNEPSFYGYMCMFALMLTGSFLTKRWPYSILLIVQIVLLAGSAISTLYLLIGTAILILVSFTRLSSKRVLSIIAFVVGFTVAIYALIEFFPGMRLSQLLYSALNDPQTLLGDESIMARVDDIGFSISTALNNGFLPALFQGRRIMSGYGNLLIDLGFPGIALIALFFCVAWKGFPGSSLWRKTVSILLTIMMFSAIQLSNPLFSFLIGLSFWGCYSQRKKIDSLTERSQDCAEQY